jgi:hypothetical protein
LSGFLLGPSLCCGFTGDVGFSGIESYGRLIVEMSGWIERKGIYPSQMHNLRAQFYIWFYSQHPVVANLLTGLSSVALLALLVRVWKAEWEPESARFGMKFSALVTISLLVSPHLNLHDLSCLLLPALLIGQISDQGASSSVRRLQRATWLVGFPLILASLVVSTWVPIQLSVWGMMGMVFLLFRALNETGESLNWKPTPTATFPNN